MTKTKKALLSVIAVIFIVAVVFGLTVSGIAIWRKTRLNRYDFSSLNGAANKTVLFIGDGMGFNHLKVASAYYQKETFVSSLEHQGEITTFSNNMFLPTDSAAAGSALATGRKYDLKQVSQYKGQNVQTVAEKAKERGLGVGIVTTDGLNGATPASFSAHAPSRGDKDAIVSCQAASGFDLFLGAGFDLYSANKKLFTDNGYAFCTDTNELSSGSGKIIAAFKSVVAENGTAEKPTLQTLTAFALEYMEANFPQGYFLMIEGAHIDKRSHDNDVMGMVRYLNGFDQSVKLACDRLQSAGTDYAVIVTADHETGGLRYKNQSKEQINDSLYRHGGHTSANVPYFLRLHTSQSVNVKSVIGKRMDNTDICKLICAFIGC